MKLIVGLGNPGRIHRYNRHNVGSLLVDRLAKIYGIKIRRDSATGCFVGQAHIRGQEVILARPLSFMNLVGNAVSPLLKKHRLGPKENLLVVCDDLDLELGKIRIRRKGSSGGHKGIDSIIKTLGSSEFPRLRIGIGRPYFTGSLAQEKKRERVVGYVLSNLRRREIKQIDLVLERAADCCKTWVIFGINKAMNRFN